MPDPAIFVPNQIITHTQLNNAFATKADAVSIAGLVAAALGDIDLGAGGNIDTAVIAAIVKQQVLAEIGDLPSGGNVDVDALSDLITQRVLSALPPDTVGARVTIGTTAERPTSPRDGDLHVNRTLGLLEAWDADLGLWLSIGGSSLPTAPDSTVPANAFRVSSGKYLTFGGKYFLLTPAAATPQQPVVTPTNPTTPNPAAFVVSGYVADGYFAA